MACLKKGCLQLYCGDGKGKTTASVGLAVRAVGTGLKVLFCQVMKDGISYLELPEIDALALNFEEPVTVVEDTGYSNE